MLLKGGGGRLRGAFASRDFRRFTVGSGVSLIGLWMQRIGVAWVTWELTGSATWLGLVAFADLFPTVLVSPLSGAVADRLDRRRIAIITQTLAMVGAGALALLAWTDTLSLGWLVALTACQGLVLSFWQPARMALLPALVPPADLGVAVAVNAVIFNAARFVGPALAGPLLAADGVHWVFTVNALSYGVMVVTLVGLGSGDRRAGVATEGLFRAMASGYLYVLGHPGMVGLLLLTLVNSLCLRPVAELLPGFADEVFHRGANGLAALAGAIGLGAMVGGLWLAERPADTDLLQRVVASQAVLVGAILGFVLTPWFSLALGCLAIAGGAMVIVGAGSQTLVQLTVDPDKRGRVMALFGMVFRGAPALGALWLGGLADRWGFGPAQALGCGLGAVMAGWVWRRRDYLRQHLSS